MLSWLRCMQRGGEEVVLAGWGKGGGWGHSLQSCEKSLLRGKVKVGETGLVTTAGAELMPLDTTEDAGTWRAHKSALGLVGSSVGSGTQEGRRGGRRGRAQEKEVGMGVKME